LPELNNIERRIHHIISSYQSEKDTLVFLPGKAEISGTSNYLKRTLNDKREILTLHGGQPLKEQQRVFSPTSKRRIILSTNVAETALTIPNIDMVIDSGLERRTCYHHGRSFLGLFPIALDSATQRMGRAGRLGPGICIRLWGSNEKIDTHTIPQIHREALEPLVLAAISCGYTNIQSLPFIEQPKQYAVSDAKNYLYAIGAICKNGMATPLGLQLFSLPIDHALGRLLIEGKAMKLLPSIIPLCSALSIRGRIFRSIEQDDDENIRKEHCDLQGLIRCIVADYPQQIYAQARKDGSEIAYRLARLWNVKSSIFPTDLQSIALCIMRAWPDCVHVRRRRG